MKVELIAQTQPSAPLVALGVKTAEDVIVHAARVSNPKNQFNMNTGAKLLRYCMDNGHWSVFETSSMTVSITTSRAISAQILRHHSFRFQEFSQRYADPSEFGVEIYEARRQDSKNRQNSIDDLPHEDREWFRHAQMTLAEDAFKIYEEATKRGIAKECARFLLPLSTQTMIYMTGNCRSWIHYFQARDADGVQKEHRDIAQAIRAGPFAEVFPLTNTWIDKV